MTFYTIKFMLGALQLFLVNGLKVFFTFTGVPLGFFLWFFGLDFVDVSKIKVDQHNEFMTVFLSPKFNLEKLETLIRHVLSLWHAINWIVPLGTVQEVQTLLQEAT